MSRAGARWVVMAAAVVAGVAGAAAVLTAAAVPAVVAGVASALVAVLVLVEDPERDEAPVAEPPDALADDPDATAEGDETEEADEDPLRELFESGPAADGSGLLGAHFVPTTLRGRLGVARRALRPLSVVCFEAYETGTDGQLRAPVATDTVATVLRRTLRDADVSGHLGDDAFVCILEDTGEDGAVWTAERVRRNLLEGGGTRRFRAGVASYPSHGLEPEELEAKARAALVAARDWATDRIEVAGGA